MFRFTIRDALWALTLSGLILALVLEHRRHNELATEAANLESAYEELCKFAVEQERWEIRTDHFGRGETRQGSIWIVTPRTPSGWGTIWNLRDKPTGKLHPFPRDWPMTTPVP